MHALRWQRCWNGTAPYLSAALLLALVTLASSATHVLPSELLPVTTAVSLGVLSKGLASVLAPLVEIRQLSRLSPQQIEEAVDLKEPLQVSVCYSYVTATAKLVLFHKLCFVCITTTAWQQTQVVVYKPACALLNASCSAASEDLLPFWALAQCNPCLQSLLSTLLFRGVPYSILDKRSCIACTEWQQGACEALGRGCFAELAGSTRACHP